MSRAQVRRWLWPAVAIVVWLLIGGPLGSLQSKVSEVQQNDNAAFLREAVTSRARP
jgi:RND superfamily putative drug exporter